MVRERIISRPINICLINSVKDVEGFNENYNGNINHKDTFLHFKSESERDNFMALKTVWSQTENSKIHNFNDTNFLRLDINMKDYYDLNADLVKVNFTKDGIENQYFYTIEDVNYVNDIVTEITVSLNVIYTYFYEVDKHQIEGVITKSNFKNKNYDLSYVNSVANCVLGDRYDNGMSNMLSREVKNGSVEGKTTLFLAITMYTKPNIVDDMQNSGFNKLISRKNASGEVVVFIPFSPSGTSMYGVEVNGTPIGTPINMETSLGYIGNLFLNGSLSWKWTGLVSGSSNLATWTQVTNAPATVATFFDIVDMTIIEDVPFNYTVESDSLAGEPFLYIKPDSSMHTDYFDLRDVMSEEVKRVPFITLKNAFTKRSLNITTIYDGNKTELLNHFTNIENNIIYNRYYVKYFNYMQEVNSKNFFSTSDSLRIGTFYLSAYYSKLLLSTEDAFTTSFNGIHGKNNINYGIKFNGKAQAGLTLGTLGSNLALDITGGALQTGVGLMGRNSGISGAFGVNHAIYSGVDTAKQMVNSLNTTGGVTGFEPKSALASNFLGIMDETRPKLIIDKNRNKETIDNLTNRFGTSCYLYNTNLNGYVTSVITNRTQNSCYMKADIRPPYIYPKAQQKLSDLFNYGILFIRTIQ